MAVSSETWDEFTSALTEATRSLEGTLNEHASETRDALSKLDRSVAVTNSKIDAVSEVVKPIPAQIARLETHVDNLHEGDKYHRTQITEVRNQVTDLEIKVATVTPSVKPFWESPNFKYLILLAVTIVTGLLALAGYQIKP